MKSLDANVLIYAIDERDGRKQEIALRLLKAASQRPDFVVADQSLLEFAHAAIRKKVLERSIALHLLADWSASVQIAKTTAPVAAVVALLQKSNLGVWDARLLATCAANGVATLFTEDMQDGGQYGPVRVLDPFNPANDRIVDELLR